jgi:hypothetical protein
MIKAIITLALSSALVFCAEISSAQQGLSTAERQRICAHEGAELGFTGGHLNLFVAKCMARKGSTPSAPPSPTAPSGRPEWPRGASCRKMALELGLSGRAEEIYIARCLKH